MTRFVPFHVAPPPVPEAVPATEGMPGLPLRRILLLLRRHAILIGLVGMAGGVGAYAYARTLPKFYTASSLIAVTGGGFTIPELQGVLRPDNLGDPMPIVRTEMQALASRDLAVRLVRELKLAQLPEFNSDLQPPGTVARAKTWLQSFLPSSPATTGVSDPMEGIVGATMSAIRIFQDNRSLAIDVGFVSQDPVLSARAANALVSEYMAVRAGRQVKANTGANEELTQRIEQVRNDITGLEKRIRDLRNSNELVLLRAGSIGQQQLEDLVTAGAKASLERGQLEASYNRATAAATDGSSATVASVLGSPTVSSLREREAAASQRIAELGSRYGGSYPGVASAQAELAATRVQLAQETQRIITSLGSQLRIARQHEADVQKQVEEARKTALGGENARAELKQLQDEVATRQKLYQTMLERVQQTTGQTMADRAPDIYVISTAAPPGGPSGPNMKFAVGFGGIGGLTLGCLLALTRLRAMPAAGRSKAGPALPGLGTVPRGLLARSRSGTPPTAEDSGILQELAGSLRSLCLPVRPQLVLFTDGGNRDGAAMLATAFARSAFAYGERALLIDADLQQPSTPGTVAGTLDLTAMLFGREWPAPISAAAPSLDRYASPVPAPEHQAALAGPVFGNLVAQARECFDLVVMVAPPLSSPVAAQLARFAEVTVVVSNAAVPVGETTVARLWPGPLAEVRVTR